MAEMRKILMNPADSSQWYQLWNNGLILDHNHNTVTTTPAAPPIFNSTETGIDIARDFAITNWITLSGYVLDAWGRVHEFGTAAPVDPLQANSIQAPNGFPGWDIFTAISVDPTGNGKGYALDRNGVIHSFGGIPGLISPLQPLDSSIADFDCHWAVPYNGTVDKLVVMNDLGDIFSINFPITQLEYWDGTSTHAPNGNLFYRIYRSVIADWNNNRGWKMDYRGLLYKWNNAPDANLSGPNRLVWAFADYARDFAVISPVDPAQFAVVGKLGEMNVWTSSTPPTATMTYPFTGETIFYTSRPTVTWTFSDPQGETQKGFRLKVYPKATTLLGGFNPDISAGAIFDSGDYISPNFAATVPSLADGEWAFYLKAKDTADLYSVWTSSVATIETPVVPPASLISITEDQIAASLEIDTSFTTSESVYPVDYIKFIGAGGVRTPSDSGLHLTGDIEIILKLAADDYTPAAEQFLVAKWDPSVNAKAYALSLLPTGFLRFYWSTNGSTTSFVDSTTAISAIISNGQPVWLRVFHDVNNGASGKTTFFEYSVQTHTVTLDFIDELDSASFTSEIADSPYEIAAWNGLSVVTTSGTTSVVASSAPLWIGAYGATASPLSTFSGKIYHMQLGTLPAFPVTSFNVGMPVNAASSSWLSGTRTYSLVGTVDLVSNFPNELMIDLQRSEDQGSNWIPVRDSDVMTIVSGVGTIVDYEAALNKAIIYRARLVSSNFNKKSSYLVSAPSVLDQDAQVWWLKDPLNSTINTTLNKAPEFTFDRRVRSVIIEPVGRENAIVIGDGKHGIKGSITFYLLTTTEYEAVHMLLDSPKALLLQAPDGEQWYIRITEDQSWKKQRGRMQIAPEEAANVGKLRMHEVALSFIEVDAP